MSFHFHVLDFGFVFKIFNQNNCFQVIVQQKYFD